MLKYKKYRDSDLLNIKLTNFINTHSIKNTFKYSVKVVRYLILIVSYQFFFFLFNGFFLKNRLDFNFLLNNNVIGSFNKKSCSFFLNGSL